jgi:hypothetical protein
MNLLQSFSIPQISRVARRTALSAVAAGVVGLAAGAALGYGWAGVGICIGLGLALANFRFTAAAAAKAMRAERADHRRPLALNTLARLGAVTVVAVGLLLLMEQLGFGTLIGLAIFQFILLANMTVSLLKGVALSSGGMLGTVPEED